MVCFSPSIMSARSGGRTLASMSATNKMIPAHRTSDQFIVATEKTVVARGRRPGEVILADARAQGADLLIKGAYTQSREENQQPLLGPAAQEPGPALTSTADIWGDDIGLLALAFTALIKHLFFRLRR